MTDSAIRYAPGWPGIPARWTSSAKSGAGTALNQHSKVWFTLSHGILNEVYFPRVDQACTRDQNIIVVHRSDGSGTSFIWTDYLSKVSPEWKSLVGSDTSVKWPLGMGGLHNEGVAGLIRQLSGSIGYVELIYAVQNKIPYGSVQNSAGVFLKASLEGVTAAAASAPKMPADFRVSITNAPGKDAYPISSFTWLLIPAQSKDAAKGKILADFLNWMVTDGQKMTSALDYAPLPDSVVAKVKEAVKQVK